jgi:hypothetical protein
MFNIMIAKVILHKTMFVRIIRGNVIMSGLYETLAMKHQQNRIYVQHIDR